MIWVWYNWIKCEEEIDINYKSTAMIIFLKCFDISKTSGPPFFSPAEQFYFWTEANVLIHVKKKKIIMKPQKLEIEAHCRSHNRSI